MQSSSALRLPDVHDFEHDDDPGDPCPLCSGATVEDNICAACGCELCETCGKVEVTGVSAKCETCAPVYAVGCADGDLYSSRSLRRAWEGMMFYSQQGYYFEAQVYAPDNVDLDFDGLTEREDNLLAEWDVVEDDPEKPGKRRVARFHLCLQRVA